MASDLNQCSFIGRLGKDPECRFLPNGDAVASFSIAVGESWKDRDTGDKKETTEWVRCVAWRKLGEICGEYLRKGQQVFVQGKMKTRKWQDKDGNDRYSTEIIVDRMQMLGSRRDDAGEAGGESGGEGEAPQKPATRQQKPAPSGAPRSPGGVAEMDDDIPF